MISYRINQYKGKQVGTKDVQHNNMLQSIVYIFSFARIPPKLIYYESFLMKIAVSHHSHRSV